PPTPKKKMSLPARVSEATDILQDPSKSALPRYAAYRRARARFWEAFPDGVYARLPTPGTNLECGFYALILSMRHQLPAGSRIATMEELRAVFGGVEVSEEGGSVGVDLGNLNSNFRSNGYRTGTAAAGWFTADQLAAAFAAWGRRYLNPDGPGQRHGQGQGRVRCQLGWVMDRDENEGEEGWPVMMNTPEVDTAEVGEGIVRVWVWNDGASLRGGVGHFEGVRRPTEGEMEGME
ncbi:hypothetical protein N657DRAFT_567543, partial [Parathielavia appendiculata]